MAIALMTTRMNLVKYDAKVYLGTAVWYIERT